RDRRCESRRQPQVPARARGVRPRTAGIRARRSHPRRRGAAVAGRRLLYPYHRRPVNVELARQHWREGADRIEAARRDPHRYDDLSRQVELVAAALRQRVGQTYTLADLARVYAGAEDWARALLVEARPED